MGDSPVVDRTRKTARPFGHPGGKTLLIKHILPLIPEHQVYVEPYCGSATIFFAKDKASRSVLGDMNSEIIAALLFVRGISIADTGWLEEQDWHSSKEHWQLLKDQKPACARERFYRFLYLNYNSWAASPHKSYARGNVARRGFKGQAGVLLRAGEKLSNTVIILQDAFRTMRQYDSISTFHYVDPPYFGSGDLKPYGGRAPAPEMLAGFLRELRGRWLLSMHDNERVRAAFRDSSIRSVSVRRRYAVYSRKTRSGQSPGTRQELLIGNYDLGTDIQAKRL